jgi:hypothetical protein
MLLPINRTAYLQPQILNLQPTPLELPTPPKTADSVTTNGYLLNRLPVCLADFIDARTEYPRALTAWVTKIARVDFSRSLFHF